MTISSTSIRGLPQSCTQAPNYLHRHSTISNQTRSSWNWSHQPYRHKEHTRFILAKHQHSQRPYNPQREQTKYHNHQQPKWVWETCTDSGKRYTLAHKTNFLGFPIESFFQRRIEWGQKPRDAHQRKHKRWTPMYSSDYGTTAKIEYVFNSMWESLTGIGKSLNIVDARVMTNLKKDFDELWGVKPQTPVSTFRESDVEENQVHDLPVDESKWKFDPISQRMVLKDAEHSEVTDRVNERHTGEPRLEQRGYLLPVERAETKTDDFAIPYKFDTSKYREKARAADLMGMEDNALSSISAEKGSSAEGAVPRASDNSFEPSEGAQRAVQMESSQPQDFLKDPSVGNDDHDAIPLESRAQSTQSLGVDDMTTSEQPLTKRHEQAESSEWSGYPSGHEYPLSMSTASVGTPETVVDYRDADLDVLRASDIRAAYHAKRLSTEAEVELERSRNLEDMSSLQARPSKDVENHVQASADWGEAMTISTTEPFIPTASNHVEPDTGSAARNEAPRAASEPPLYDSAAVEVYRVFADDSTSLQVAEAETISSVHASSGLLHPTDVLTRLANPVKFLPCLKQMHVEGYEIVSGGKNILVFRKVPKPGVLTTGSTTQRGDRETLTEDVRFEDMSPEEQPAVKHYWSGGVPPQSASSVEEPSDEEPPVEQFQVKSPPKSMARRTLRRMLISGVAMAGTCFAVSTVSEYFRTGGKDGWGIDGFTVFESEREHRQ
ncbi:hypothetical protein BJX99DRAFT_161174 [Aspergillus californicus]